MNNKRFILGSDYDGTFCRSRDGITSENVKAVQKFREKGHLFGIVSGRDYTGGYLAFKSKNQFDFDFIVTNNGAAACDADGNILFTHPIKNSVMNNGKRFGRVYIERCLELTSMHCGVALEKTRFEFHPELPDGGELNGRVYSPLSVMESIDEFVSSNAVCKSVKEATFITQKLKEEFGDVLCPIQNGVAIDVTSAGVDKAWGLKKLAEYFNVDKDCIWTAGDNYNDIPILSEFHGCAMKSGIDAAKESAEYVCDTVAEFIELILRSEGK